MASAAGSGAARKPPAWAPFAAAAMAATAELSIMQPLDVVKTRMHLQGLGVQTGDNFGGTWAAIRGIRDAEGVGGLWRGFVPGLCVVIPRRGFKFLFYDAFVGLFWKGEKGKAPFIHSMAAGGLAGGAEACVITPLECIKIGMQSEKASGGAAHGTIAFARAMVASGGIGALYSGLAATVVKHTAHSCFYFAAFHEAKKFFKPTPEMSQAKRMGVDLTSGFVAGCAAATANNPFDVVKTRMQVGAASGMAGHAAAAEFSSGSQRSLPQWMMELVRTEGPQALYKGYIAKVARLGPGSAIIFCMYEQFMRLF